MGDEMASLSAKGSGCGKSMAGATSTGGNHVRNRGCINHTNNEEVLHRNNHPEYPSSIGRLEQSVSQQEPAARHPRVARRNLRRLHEPPLTFQNLRWAG